ncbi:proteasome-type protease [Sulfitobacter guttiformis]|uniref:Putative proteasome-type protease n=1 Tax=Sulfitobacter guttiformis TaxID=74349 RepID=A0A420DSY6_9RHOB|nr:proteasome-type protease [Sulfitobacter guttiformis]KIN74864.1 Proteasome-like protein [Sulfitobacter guttiformis KCTC 32187]RKE97434.1 putative proteasome-type protease [Sulfitobacter guttiformis]
MTYCVGLRLNRGLVFMADTRTNAGVDNFSTTKKMFTWNVPGERTITIMTAGNLATTQALISVLEERSKTVSERNPTLLEQPTMFQVARLVGATLQEVIRDSAQGGQTGSSRFTASVIVGGQIKGGAPTLFLVYPEGNFIEVTDDAPFFQIGEAKYGKPILVRAYQPDMSFEDTIKLLLVSFDSTIKANLSVGMPLDLQVYAKDSFSIEEQTRIEADNPYYQTISDGWGDALRTALMRLPSYRKKGMPAGK